jgi:PAS domain S-box-containing protein
LSDALDRITSREVDGLSQMTALAEAARTVMSAPDLPATLQAITEAARAIVGAHQCICSMSRDADWSQAINATSLSDKYARWRDFAVVPDGSGIYAWICEENLTVRMSQDELEAHPRWRGFGKSSRDHPPMRGWLATALVGSDGRNLGIVQLSDKIAGEFDQVDEAVIVQLAQIAASAIEKAQAVEELRAAEAARRVERDLLHSVLRQAPVGISIAEAPSGRAVVLNEKAKELLGHHVVGDGVGRYERLGAVHPDGTPYAVEDYPTIRALTKGETVEQEDMIYRRGDRTETEVTRFAVSSAPVRDQDGRIVAAATVFIDVEQQRRTEVALRESEARLSMVLESVSDGFYALDADWRFIVFNTAAERYFGRRRDEVLGRNVWDAFPEARGSEFESRYSRIMAGGPPETFAARSTVRPDRVLEMRAAPQPEGGITVSFSDVTERIRAEQIIQERNTRLEILAEAIEKAPSARTLDELMEIVGRAARRLSVSNGVAIVLRDGDQCFYAAEHSDRPLWGGQRFPMVTCVSGWAMLNRKTVVVPDVRDDPRIPHEIYDPTFIRSLIVVPIVSDGVATAAIGVYWSEVHSPSEGEMATLEALARSAGAVLRRIEVEEALRQLNETLETQVAERTADRDRIWRLSTDVMLVARFDGTITAVNPAWTRLFGWREDEMLGRNYVDFVHPDDHGRTLAEADKLSRGIATLRFENRYRRKDGSYQWLSWIAVPDESLIHAVGRDVTAEKEAAEALRQTEEALRQAQKMEAIGQLTGGIAHDFNNLLTGIVGSLDLMQARIAQGRTDGLERYAKAAMSSASRAAALTHRLLAFARRQPLDPRAVDVKRLVVSMEDLLRRSLGETIQTEFVTDEGLWLTRCDPNQLESAILNLAINARDAMPDGGKLTIETRNVHIDGRAAAAQHHATASQFVCISVADTGVGMTPDVVERAFEPFFTTKPIGQGTGLGLSMIYGFAQQSGGHADISSKVGRGTTVKIYLPRFDGRMEEDIATSGLTDAPRAEAGETVLVVEDDPVVRGLIVEVLKDLGYHALEAADGPSGLRILQSSQRIDLLVSDVGLPGLNGRQLADQSRERRPDLKVLFITGYAESAAVTTGFLDPGMEMITKPFAVEALAIRIREMIER